MWWFSIGITNCRLSGRSYLLTSVSRGPSAIAELLVFKVSYSVAATCWCDAKIKSVTFIYLTTSTVPTALHIRVQPFHIFSITSLFIFCLSHSPPTSQTHLGSLASAISKTRPPVGSGVKPSQQYISKWVCKKVHNCTDQCTLCTRNSYALQYTAVHFTSVGLYSHSNPWVPAVTTAAVRVGEAASVTLCDPIWHSGFCSGVVASSTNYTIRLYFAFLKWHATDTFPMLVI